MFVEQTKAGPLVAAIFKESITGPALGTLVGFTLQFILDRIYDDQLTETNLLVVTPFLLYYLCDNQWFDINGIFAMPTYAFPDGECG